MPKPGSTEPTFGPTWPNTAFSEAMVRSHKRRQNVAAADGKALHARDHGLGHVADQRLQFVDRQADGAAALVGALVRALVGAGAERAVAGAAQHDHGDRLVPAGAAERVDQFLAGLRGEGVVFFRAVDRDLRDAVAHIEQDVLVFIHLSYPCMVRPPETLMVWPVM